MVTKVPKNMVDPEVLDRSNHTGTQAIGTVVGLQAALDARFALALSEQSANYDVTANDNGDVVSIDASAGNRTVTLPVAAGNAGLRLIIRKADTSTNTITIDPNASETIDGAATKVLRQRSQSVALYCTGSEWVTLSDGVIFERGANANGEYVKYADGTMICTFAVGASSDAWTVASGSFFVSALYTWTFPAVFAATPVVQPVGLRAAQIAMGGNLASCTVSAATYYMWASVSLAAATSKTIHIKATGRWF